MAIHAFSRVLPTPIEQAVSRMRQDKSYLAQLSGCWSITVDSSKKDLQDSAAAAGAIEAIVGAMDLFPEDVRLITECTVHLSTLVLFNRENGLRAGRLGALNRTLHVYMQHMDVTVVMSLGGAIGAFFDYVDENRLIARELGGIQAIIQNIKNHFHGKYGDWTYEPVKQSLFALSSGCYVNQDICFNEGFPELAVKLMSEHGHEEKIAEETQQVTKALMFRSEEYRAHLADLGMTDSMVHVLQVSPDDRGAIDLTCENFAWLVGPHRQSGPTGLFQDRPFSKTIQSKALQSGALEAIAKVVTHGRAMHHADHAGFNFDIDAAYNVKRDCFMALAGLGHENPEARSAMLKAGVADAVQADLAGSPKYADERYACCLLVRELAAVETEQCLRQASRSPALNEASEAEW
eukprot:CAMPEP_0197936728 /NCGR_PEP_ID=MMETSP1439-20131203/115409_1 /TAXON_ID=66791 /ORGANISM="Gonyaulax spinifera, Strain CCMP409" /LENGTH=405 /DNA_ID=CAMNT_0043559715 /DNA_START=101 /DNA_END=1316 /DNA_ORIENTATION=+